MSTVEIVTHINSPVHNIVFVQMFEREDQLGNVEPGSGLGKSTLLLQVPEQFSSTLVIRDEKEVILGLETEFQPDEEGRVE